jgi:spoIIIJ-associated protein
MEWVETTAKTLDEAREKALDQLGVGLDDAEFDILEEPRPGLFGRVRGEARLRARVRPTQARPKQERRRKTKSDRGDKTEKAGKSGTDAPKRSKEAATASSDDATPPAIAAASAAPRERSNKQQQQGDEMSDDNTATVTPDEVGAAAVAFMDGLTEAFGLNGTSEITVDGIELELNVVGEELGLLVGPGGRTLNAVQDLARVAAQRRLGDHETRLRIDVAGYRGRREQALVKFSREVAEQVRSSGVARSLEPMTSSDRKVIHDVLNEEEGVASRSVGEDPTRRIIVEPA